jgi:hypothetical protein
MSLINDFATWYASPERTANPHKMSGVLPEPNREMSALSKTKYAYIFDGLDDMELPEATIDAMMANREIDRRINTSATEANTLASRNREQARALRDARKSKDMVRTSIEAKAKLQDLGYRQSFFVPNELTHNMQALISYYNGKPDGKRFKSKRAGEDRALEITRMR